MFQNGRLNKKKNTPDRCLKHLPAKIGFLVHDDVIREAQKFIFVMFLKSLGIFVLIDNSNCDEKICPLRYRYMTFFSLFGGHFENMTSSWTAGVQISETLFFYNVGPMTFQKNIVLNFHHLVCAKEYIFGPLQCSTIMRERR